MSYQEVNFPVGQKMNYYYVSHGDHLESLNDAKRWKNLLSNTLASSASYSDLKNEIDEPLMTKNCPVPEDTSECWLGTQKSFGIKYMQQIEASLRIGDQYNNEICIWMIRYIL